MWFEMLFTLFCFFVFIVLFITYLKGWSGMNSILEMVSAFLCLGLVIRDIYNNDTFYAILNFLIAILFFNLSKNKVAILIKERKRDGA